MQDQAASAQNAGDYASAERLHRNVLEGTASLPGFPPSQRARLMSNLASVLNLQQRPTEALALLKQAEALLGEQKNADPSQVVALHLNFAKAYAEQRDYKAAEGRYDAGRKILEDQGALDSLAGQQYLAGLANVYGHTNRVEQARALYERVLPFFLRLTGPNHPVYLRIESEYKALPGVRK